MTDSLHIGRINVGQPHSPRIMKMHMNFQMRPFRFHVSNRFPDQLGIGHSGRIGERNRLRSQIQVLSNHFEYARPGNLPFERTTERCRDTAPHRHSRFGAQFGNLHKFVQRFKGPTAQIGAVMALARRYDQIELIGIGP